MKRFRTEHMAQRKQELRKTGQCLRVVVTHVEAQAQYSEWMSKFFNSTVSDPLFYSLWKPDIYVIRRHICRHLVHTHPPTPTHTHTHTHHKYTHTHIFSAESVKSRNINTSLYLCENSEISKKN